MKSYNHSHTNNRFSIFGINIDNLTMEESVNRLLWSARNNGNERTKLAYFVNANSLNQAYESESLTATINRSDYVFADGSGVKLAAKNIGVTVKENVNGTDMLPILCEKAARQGLSLFFLGGAPKVAKQAAKNLVKKYPNLKITGTHHGFINKADSKKIISRINNSKADILLVGMGTPIQEHWLDDHADSITAKASLAVGGLFDFYSGRIPRAPRFFRKKGIEWVWRLFQEPRAKFHRYVIGNPLFLYRIAFN